MIRPSHPAAQSGHRKIVYFGGPLDGLVTEDYRPAPGYRDSGMALVIWNKLNASLLWPGIKGVGS